MEARILGEKDAKRYFALRVQAAGDDVAIVTNDLKREHFAFADSPTTAVAVHASQGPVAWGVYDDISLAGVVAISRRFAIQALNHLWLRGLYVRPPYRGIPVSRLVMEVTLSRCDGEPPAHRLFSAHGQSKYHARHCLHHWGFLPVPGRDVSTGPSIPESTHILMECDRASRG